METRQRDPEWYQWSDEIVGPEGNTDKMFTTEVTEITENNHEKDAQQRVVTGP